MNQVDSIVIRWNNSEKQVIPNPAINQLHAVKYNPQSKEQNSLPNPGLFVDQSNLISPAFTHTENEFDDFQVQVLIPHRFSRLGPCLAKGDVNGDGLEDFFVGGAMGDEADSGRRRPPAPLGNWLEGSRCPCYKGLQMLGA